MHRGARAIDLTATEFKLLHYLLLNTGRVVSKSQILDRVWNYDFDGNANVVEIYISYLRKKIDAHGPRLIHTVRGVGYSLCAPRRSRPMTLRLRLLLVLVGSWPWRPDGGRRGHLLLAALLPFSPGRQPAGQHDHPRGLGPTGSGSGTTSNQPPPAVARAAAGVSLEVRASDDQVRVQLPAVEPGGASTPRSCPRTSRFPRRARASRRPSTSTCRPRRAAARSSVSGRARLPRAACSSSGCPSTAPTPP